MPDTDIRDLNLGLAIQDGDLFISRQSADIEDVTVTGLQIKDFILTANVISNSLFRQSAGLSVVGRSANTTGNVADITAASNHNVLRRSGSTIGFGQIALNQGNAVTGTLGVGNGGTGASTFTQGSVVFAGASGVYTQNNARFFWDNSNERLGIGLTNPGSRLHVSTVSTTAIGLRVSAVNLQSANIAQFESGGGTVLGGVTSGGNFFVGTSGSATDVFSWTGTTLNVGGRFGEAFLGNLSWAANYAIFSHNTVRGGNGFAMAQQSTGETFLNAAFGTRINFRINNAGIMRMTATGLSIRTPNDPVCPLDFGATVNSQCINLFTSGNTRYGIGVASGEIRFYVTSSGTPIYTLGTMSASDGTTFTEKTRFKLATGEVGFNTNNPLATIHGVCVSASAIGQIIQAAGSQTANLTEWQNSSAGILASISANGSIFGAASLALPIANLNSNTTLNTTHFTVNVDTSGGNVTITLPTASTSAGRIYNIKKLSGSNTLTIQRSSSDTIYSSSSGNTSVALTADGSAITLQADSANNRWMVI